MRPLSLPSITLDQFAIALWNRHLGMNMAFGFLSSDENGLCRYSTLGKLGSLMAPSIACSGDSEACLGPVPRVGAGLIR